jgi:MoaA/NifB/PqqE/SkfB family radical SAM enzyme
MLTKTDIDPLLTAAGDPRGYIRPHALDELWFHTGTACNLACPFCLEGSKPGDNRLQRITLDDARPLIDEAVTLGVRQFSFTGGEPFLVKDFINILAGAAAYRPCLVLTNGTEPVLRRLRQLRRLQDSPHPVSFRVSIDYPDADRHDAGRGAGNFQTALQGLKELQALGFGVSVARQMTADENADAVDQRFRQLFAGCGLPEDLRIVAFPDFGIPGEDRDVPAVTEDCMTRYQTEDTRRAFMCAFSKMVVKQGGRMRVYACTLVDDDPSYDLGGTLREAMQRRIMLHHHRCYACFRFGASCSEL